MYVRVPYLGSQQDQKGSHLCLMSAINQGLNRQMQFSVMDMAALSNKHDP